MANPQTPSPSPAFPTPPLRRKTARKLAKRALIGASGLLAILLVVFFLLPQWISDDQGRAYVLQQFNKRMDVTLSVSNWSVGWFHGTTLTNVTVTLPDGTPLLTCPAIHSELTLWGIIRGNYDVGTTTADTLHLHIIKHTDGSTSLDSLFGKNVPDRTRFFGALRTLRGSLLAKSAQVAVTSDATQETVVYSDVNAAVTIASSDSPFHIEVSASAPERSLFLGATLPPLARWSAQQPDAIIAASDFDLRATRLPVRLLCDFAGLDPQWEASIGTEILTLTVAHHQTPPDYAGMFSCFLRGSAPDSAIDVKLLLHPPTASSLTSFSLPATASDCHFSAALNISPPLGRLLAFTNPLFAQLDAGEGPVHITLSDGAFFPDAPALDRTSARITFPSLTFRREGLIAELLQQSPRDDASSPGAPNATIAGIAAPLRIRLSNGRITSQRFVLTFARRQPITFQGSVAIDGQVEMLATIPSADNTLGTAMIDVPITGTIDHPVLTLPR